MQAVLVYPGNVLNNSTVILQNGDLPNYNSTRHDVREPIITQEMGLVTMVAMGLYL